MGIRDDLKDRLVGLAAAIGLEPGERLGSFLDRFGPYLSHYMEYGVLYDAPSVAALSIGQGTAFHDALAQWLIDEGIGGEDRERVQRLRRRVDDWMVLKVDVVGPAQPRVGVYLRRGVPLDALDAVLLADGVSQAVCDRVHKVARVLEVDCAQIVALGLGGDSPDTKLYLGVCRDGGPALDRVEAAFDEVGAPFGDARLFLEALPDVSAALAGGVLVSVFLSGDTVVPVAKLDLFGVALRDVDRACRACGVDLQGRPGPAALGERLGLRTAEHTGLLFRRAAPPALSLYFPFDR